MPDSARATPPNVLVVTHLFPLPDDPTVGPWVAEQVDALRTHVPIEVLCCARTGADAESVRDSGVRVTYRDTTTPLGAARLGLIASSWRYAHHLRRYLACAEPLPDIVHSHFGFPDAVIAGREARRVGVPHVVTLHGSDVERVLARSDALGRSMATALRQAAAVICVSEALAARVRELAGRTLPLWVVPSGYDASVFCIAEGPSREGVLFVGALRVVKNVDVLIDSVARAAEHERMPLTVVGDGPMRPALERLAEERGAVDLVRFEGTLDRAQVADRMRRARLLALPSSSEGWGAVVAEALACGTPVVASRVGGVPEILASERGGLLVEPGRPDELASAMLAVYRKAWDAAAVAAASRAPTTAQSAERLAALYKEIA